MSRILIIDDSQTEFFSLKEFLTKQGHDVTWATNGFDGIEMAVAERPDLILMDVVMPELNGFQATRRLSRHDATKHIPVVMITTKNQETDKIWGMRQGASEYLTKPINQKQLLKVMKQLL